MKIIILYIKDVMSDLKPGLCCLMATVLVSGSSAPGSSSGRGHCVVFLGKRLYPHSASHHPGV